jgi:UDP-2,3-diacylglucosamine pyrophosphatase LpxH
MKLAILSDIHLNDNLKASDFKHNDDYLFNYLTKLLQEVDYIVLNGDIFELLHSKWPTKSWRKKKFETIKNFYSQTYNLITTNQKIILLTGNHDADVKEFCGAGFNTKFYTVDNKVIYLEHGISDFFNKKLPRLGILFAWLGGLFVKLFNFNINWLYKLDCITDLNLLGQILYTHYVIQFLILGMILLLAVLGAVALTFNNNKILSRNSQSTFRQVSR